MVFLEGQTVELKREYVEDIKKSVVAFANTNDGVIYVGVNDDGSIAGIKNVDSVMLQLANALRDNIKPDVTFLVDYEVEMIQTASIVKLTVKKGTSCPYYLASKGIRPEGVYIRKGPSNFPATETMILKMIKETDGEKYDESRSIHQSLTFAQAENEFSVRKIPFGTSEQKSLKITSSDGVYTNLGLLLSDQCTHTIKVAVFQGTEKTIFRDRREFEGSLFDQLNKVYDFIDRYNRIRAEVEGLYRIDTRDYPPDAVREALLNAIIHRDYGFSASILISIFDDRIEFISIGGLPKGVSRDDIMMGVSMARNEKLATVFYRLSLIEAYGTGIQKIIKSYSTQHIQPKFEITENAFKVTLPNINEATESIYKNNPLQRIDIKHVDKINEPASIYQSTLPYSKREKQILSMFDKTDSIVRKDVETELGISQPMAVRWLKQLLNKGAIKTIGKGKNIQYIKNLPFRR